MKFKLTVGVIATLLVAAPGCSSSPENTSEPREGTLQVPGSTISYDVRGSGPAVVFIHGGGFDRRLWDGQVNAFARHFRVIRYDVRGAGRSGPSDSVPFGHHEDLSRLLTHLGVQRASLVGQSLGGRIAFDLALMNPNLVDRIVAVGPGVSGWPWARSDFGDWIDTMSQGATTKDTAMIVRGWLSSGYMQSVAERPDVGPLVARYARDNARMWLDDSREAELSPPALPRLESIAARTLVIVGSRDERVILRLVDSLAARLPDVRREIFEGAGHAPNLEDPERFNSTVIEFLRSSAPSPVLDYLGQTPPGLTPARFSYGALAPSGSKPRIPVFSRNGELLVFNMGDPSQVYVSEKRDSGWRSPSLAPFSREGANWEPFLLPDDRTLLFVSTRAPGKAPYQGRIWRTRRLESGGWEPPTLAHSTVEPEGLWFPTARDLSHMYFSGSLAGSIGDSDLWRVDLTSERPAITNLGAPLNSAGIEWDPYPSPDGRYLLFASDRAGGQGRVDLYVAFRKADSTWSDPVNLGPGINSSRNEVAAVLSPDGKYLFFIREPDELYWVSSEVIQRLRSK